jgi:tRNA (guanine37-N1)-methyltransferase
MSKESSCIKVPKTFAQKTLILANKLEIADRELEVQQQLDTVHIPLIRNPSEEEETKFRAETPDFEIEVHFFPERKRRQKTIEESLENQLPPHLLAILPRALDVIGDIAIIEVPPELKAYEEQIGEAILKRHRNVLTVLAKAGAVSGTYRLREFTLIAGEQKTSTVHKEFGCTFHVDVAQAYFSPRLSHEHKRVASLVQQNETVVDLFAGVGPFSVLIAKHNKSVKIYAVDINPEAINLLKRNIRVNRVENRVFPILGDARQIVEKKLVGVADRVIMNLPENATEFVEAACEATKQAGGIIHFYGFVHLPDTLETMKLRFSEAVYKAERKVERFLFAKTIRETAPYQLQFVLDAKIV